MLKGTTRIELTDVNTGEVETYQNSNMVTNALRDILKPLGLSKRPNRFLNEFVPYYEKLLGGILCFDREIPENADEYYPPGRCKPCRLCFTWNAEQHKEYFPWRIQPDRIGSKSERQVCEICI